MPDTPSVPDPSKFRANARSLDSASVQTAAARERSPFGILQRTATAFWLSRCLHTIADIGVADVLGDEAMSAAQLAAATGAHADAPSLVWE